jgi:SAM-dependent methyltransferase
MRYLQAAVLCVALCGCESKPELDFGHGLDVPYVQTAPGVARRMLEMAKVGSNDVVIDLGCGDGRIVIAAAAEFGARGIGYDLDPRRIAEARRNARLAGVESRTRFEQADFFHAPISEASVVTMFLLPPVLQRMEPRLRSELGPGTRIVSHSFFLRGWPPEEQVQVQGRTLYRWTVPERSPVRLR